ncbi:sulfatase [Arenibacter sp. BSSL-BM3]|uniref:Sulfatase n=1 Tax=Arenibacter arenosicollis TaxID=2762274 RepID=A0ABR7QRW0_9FLAO|nr:sulfatase [Arenibacter arenosicollis]MBC8769929.1 sulfatase [Arenibacter arenosicollis]
MKQNSTVPRLLILTFCTILISCQEETKSKVNEIDLVKPNVIFINVDDLGWKDIGFMGDEFFETPNIDQLASESMVFTRSYSAAANCAPSRASLMTGLNTPRHGVYTVSPSARGNKESRKLIPIKNTDSLLLKDVTMAELFKMAGYTTGVFGKWHLGINPVEQGFDVNKGGDLRGNPGLDGYFSPYNNLPHLEDGPEGENLTDRLTREGIQFIKGNKDRPFFLYLPFYAVHTPLQAKQGLVLKYDNKFNSRKISPVYAAMVETVDQNVGKIMKSLTDLGLEENTILIFTSDNGGIRSISTQDPLRAGKGSYYEGGIRVPCLIKWPGTTIAEKKIEEPITNLDFFPTFMEILKVDLPDYKSDGNSLIPVLKGGAIGERPLFWHFPIYLEAYDSMLDDGRDPLFRTRPGSVVMLGDWKLHYYYEDQGMELYNLREDIGERNNLTATKPAKTSELLNLLKDWVEETGAPIPKVLNPDYVSERNYINHKKLNNDYY